MTGGKRTSADVGTRHARLALGENRRAGNCTYDARIFRVSNPLLEVERLRAATVPESDCLLRHPFRGEHLDLWPWLLLEDCPQCMRQMVFFYDHLEPEGVVVREYPNNHRKRNGDSGTAISQRHRVMPAARVRVVGRFGRRHPLPTAMF